MRSIGLGLPLLLVGCSGDGVIDEEAAEAARAKLSPQPLAGVLRSSPLPTAPIDPSNQVAGEPRAVELGRALFYDERLSSNGAISCATCHDPLLDWTDGKETAVGLSSFGIHTPSLWNVAFNRWYFWDGRADSLWAQAIQPWEHPDEMGGDRVSFTRIIQSDEELSSSYESLFGELPDTSRWPSTAKPVGEDSQDPMQLAWDSMDEEARQDATQVLVNMAKAVAAFEREIVSGEAPFDRYVRGLKTGDPADLSALDEEQLFGMELFFNEARCHLCHHGPLFSDLEFHDVRLPYAVDEAGGELREFGRWEGIKLVLKDPFNGLGEHSDASPLAPNELAPNSGSARGHLEFLLRTPHTKGEFKTAGLRNVERTAPYTHRGVYKNLDDVIEHYSSLHDAPLKQHSDTEEILIALQLSESEKRALVSFLGSLTGELSTPKLLQPPTK